MIARSQVHIDSYDAAKVKQAKAASRPKVPRGFGSLGGDGGPLQSPRSRPDNATHGSLCLDYFPPGAFQRSATQDTSAASQRV
jgi:hypothetical protein